MEHRLFHSSFFRIATVSVAMMFVAVIVTAGIALNVFSRALEEKQRVIEHQAAMALQDYALDKYIRISGMLGYTNTRSGVSTCLAAIEQNPESAYSASNIQYLLSFTETVCSSDADFQDCILIAQTGTVYSQTTTQYGDAIVSYDFLHDSVFEAFLAEQVPFRFIHDNPSRYSISSEGDVVSILWAIYDPKQFPRREQVGLLIVNIPVHRFETAYSEFSGVMLGSLQLIGTFGDEIFSAHSIEPGADMSEPSEYPVGKTGMTVRSTLPQNLIREQRNELIRKAGIVVLLVVGLSLGVIFTVVLSYNRRSRQLIAHMRQMQKGRLDRRIPIARKDEIGILSEALNDMAEKLNEHIERTYQAELAARESEIALLQMQINPHFLYNSLENMSMLAAQQHNDALADLAADLGQLFRISIRSRDRIVRLENELEYIRLYMNIHTARFGSGLRFAIRADSAMLGYAIPKLILQPLVENAVIHGHRVLREGAWAEVVVEKIDETSLRVAVRDNGEGMSEEKIREVLCGNGSIGLPNVAKRLRLMFNEACALHIESAVGEGTSVSFILPAMSVEEMRAYVQAVDR